MSEFATIKKPSIKLTTKEIRFIINGLKPQDTVEFFDKGHTVHRHVNEKLSQRARKIDIIEAKQLRKQGWTLRRIAKKYGVTHQAVEWALKYMTDLQEEKTP